MAADSKPVAEGTLQHPLNLALFDHVADLAEQETSGDIRERLRVALLRATSERARKHRPMTKEARREFLSYLASGMAVDQAAELAGVASATVYMHRNKDEAFAAEWSAALDASCGPIERRLEHVAMTASVDSMAGVRAAETLLKGRSRRYHPPQQPRQAGEMTLSRGDESLTFKLSAPGPD